jgi:hypothetical protein
MFNLNKNSLLFTERGKEGVELAVTMVIYTIMWDSSSVQQAPCDHVAW